MSMCRRRSRSNLSPTPSVLLSTSHPTPSMAVTRPFHAPLSARPPSAPRSTPPPLVCRPSTAWPRPLSNSVISSKPAVIRGHQSGTDSLQRRRRRRRRHQRRRRAAAERQSALLHHRSSSTPPSPSPPPPPSPSPTLANQPLSDGGRKHPESAVVEPSELAAVRD